MDSDYEDFVLEQLREKGFTVEAGLSKEEVASVETEFGFRFPPDLRRLLQRGMPTSGAFPDWRSGSYEKLRARLCGPLDGILFDIQHNVFWLSKWGERPASLDEAQRIATEKVEQAPLLVPVYSQRFIPTEPLLRGNPIYSVHQTDIIYYGFDLPSYFLHEFKIPAPISVATTPREIRFWSLLVS